MDTQYCRYCNVETPISGLIGIHTNQCPHCNNPILPTTFGNISVGVVFIDVANGGMWCKYNKNKAVCVEDDSAFKIGEKIKFLPDEAIFPY